MSAIKNHYFDWINSEAFTLQNPVGNDCDPSESQPIAQLLSKPTDSLETEPLPF